MQTVIISVGKLGKNIKFLRVFYGETDRPDRHTACNPLCRLMDRT